MKKYTYSLLAAALACGIAQAAATAYTTPVGYISHTINNAGGAPALTLVSPSLVQASEFAGQSTVSPSGGNTITFSGGVPATFGATYVLEITEGASEGWWSTVTSSTATSITVVDNFPGSLPANTKVSVRLHNTIKSFLGANAPGLTPFDGVATADEVQLLNASTPGQPITSIVYVPAAVSGAPEDGWFDLATSTPADDVIVEPGTSLLVKQNSAANKVFVSTGTVKLTKTQVDIFPGLNFVGSHSAAGNTLNGMGFATQLIPFDGVVSNFDELQYINPDQSITPYASLDPSLGLGVTMGNLSTSADAGSDPFSEGTGAIIKHDAGEPADVIVISGSTVSP